MAVLFGLYKLCALSPVVIVYDENDNFHCLPVTHSIMCLIFITVYSGNFKYQPTIVAIYSLSDEGCLTNMYKVFSLPQL